ncbi:phosphatidylinositol 4-kinase [Pseudomonas syringae pv. syringae]|uniref:hypothetical protein n=1 Tax=Pseudomonas TaxID=286 RepID=UPI0006B913F2|nr:hypothetical protein [Pseudomonas syringae]MEE4675337.1 hypothetical protein [Pseudomonas alliivorans]MCF5550639.1 hypothetical protein [Pseudomonas syringae]MCH5498825.1 phosphatidylinositol 4-kinase [Pseudomonas syringae pv. syringae]MCH5525148.1 phosphatidylinositol 4-kinase [Pseudomonas syringae pv. syringae]MCH5560200.1 phosphatidylinositol 4-kinase [Pseudomonas syringae pv. syringae]
MQEEPVQIRIGRLLPGGQLVGEGANQPWRGIAATVAGEVAVIAKRISNREMAVEVVCAALGRSAGLPIPEPLLLLDSSNEWHFGSADTGHPNISKFVSSQDNSILDELERWPELLAAACFDELIANPDRHDGNILFNGQGFLLIDHGLCLPSGMRPSDSSDDYYANRFLDLAISVCRDDLSTERAARRAAEWAERKSQPAVDQAETCIFDHFESKTQNQLISFLKERISSLGEMLHHKIKPTAQGRLKL